MVRKYMSEAFYVHVKTLAIKKCEIIGGVSPLRAEYRVLISEYQYGSVCDKASVEKRINREDESWFADLRVQARAPPEDLATAVKPAFGFWLFPLEAFGPMTKDGMRPDYEAKPDMSEPQPKDLSARWPELVLCDFHETSLVP